jgi:hypothetical protein
VHFYANPETVGGSSMTARSVFSTLFTYRNRQRITPRENFLTQAFAYVLEADKVALSAFLKHVANEMPEDDADHVTISTQCGFSSTESTERSVFDMVVRSQVPGREFILLCEHKWGTGINQDQLRKYRQQLSQSGLKTKLLFITDSIGDRAEAIQAEVDCSLLWGDVCRLLRGVEGVSQVCEDFLEFLKDQGLAMAGSLTVANMAAFVHSHRLPETMIRYCVEMQSRGNSLGIPSPFFETIAPQHESKHGRVVFQFQHEDWDPGLSMGFLYDGLIDLKLELLNPKCGIDLMMRIEIKAKDRPVSTLGRSLAALERVRSEFKKHEPEGPPTDVLLLNDDANKNLYTLFLIRTSLADVLRGTDREDKQIDSIHKCLSGWSSIVFDPKHELLDALTADFANPPNRMLANS